MRDRAEAQGHQRQASWITMKSCRGPSRCRRRSRELPSDRNEMKRLRRKGACLQSERSNPREILSNSNRAMAASMQHDMSNPVPVDDESETSSLAPDGDAAPALPAAVLPTVLSGRAQMEAERIARQKAREAAGPTSGTTSTASSRLPTQTSSRVATMSDLTTRNDAGPSTAPSSSKANGSGQPRRPATHHPLQSPGPFPSDAAGEYYLDGELRHVALTIGQPSQARTFSPQQVVGTVSHA